MPLPYQPVTNVLHAAINFSVEGMQAQNNLYFLDLTGEREIADFEALADMIVEAWDTTVKIFVPNECILRNVTVTDLTTETGTQQEFIYDLAGTSTAVLMNTGSTFTTKFSAIGRGRSYRGRNYFVGLSVNQADTNVVDSDLLTATLGMYNFIKAQAPIVASVPFAWVIVQRNEDKVRLDEGIPHPIVAVSHEDPFVDYQRRRGAGRGS